MKRESPSNSREAVKHVPVFSSLRSRVGAGLTEYVLLVFLVAVFVLGGVMLVGDNVRAIFSAEVYCLAGDEYCTPATQVATADPDRWG